MSHGNDTLTVYLDDPVSDTHAASLGDAASHQAANLRSEMVKKFDFFFAKLPPVIGMLLFETDWLLPTMPFCTLKPSWNLRSGLLMRTVVTGGQLTMLSFTFTWFFRPWNEIQIKLVAHVRCKAI